MTSELSDNAALPREKSSQEIEWSSYSHHYDLMCELNPSYQDNVKTLRRFLKEWNLNDEVSVCDLGAGTGNYICSMHELLPKARYTHVDFDTEMNGVARSKYEEAGIKVDIVQASIEETDFADSSFDLVVCVNALYAISPQHQVLSRVRSWLKPEGKFFVIDFGRPNRPMDWFFWVTKQSLRSHGIVRTAKAVMQSMDLVRQNANGRKAQETGRYWLHSTEQFVNALSAAGFRTESVTTCYRGYCDLAVCTIEK